MHGWLGIIDTLTACIDGDHDNTIVCIITLHIHDVSVIQALESQAVLITKVGRTRKCEVGSRQSGELAIVIMGSIIMHEFSECEECYSV